MRALTPTVIAGPVHAARQPHGTWISTDKRGVCRVRFGVSFSPVVGARCLPLMEDIKQKAAYFYLMRT